MAKTLRLIAVIASCTVLANAQATGPTSWSDIVREIVTRVPGFNPGPGFQIVPLPTRAQWDDPKLGNYYLWQTLANKMPQWGEVYLPSLKTVTDGYHFFLTNLALPPAGNGNSEASARIRRNYLEDSRRLHALLANASNWENGTLKRRKASDAQKLRARIRSHAARYSALLAEAHGSFLAAGELLTEFENPAYQREARSPDGLTLSYRTFNINPDLATWVAESRTRPVDQLANVVVRRPPPTRAPGQVKPVDALTRDPITGEMVPDPRSEMHFWVLRDKQAPVPLDENQIAGFDIKGRRIALFFITPGRWFNGAALQFFRDGPWLDGPVKDGRVPMWGEKGLLNLMPSAVVVLYEPTVSLRARNQQESAVAIQLQSLMKTSKEVSFGPFNFSAESSRVTVNPPAGAVTITDLSGRPYIVAVVNAVLPDARSSNSVAARNLLNRPSVVGWSRP